MSEMIPVIISGGSGTRLWPISRGDIPKQLCAFAEKSLLEETIDRLSAWTKPWILTTQELALQSERILREADISPDHVLIEPVGRNTAPAIAFLCKRFVDLGLADRIVGVFPADHFVRDAKTFRQAVDLGIESANSGNVVTLGIRPNRPATGFGYVETNGKAIATQGSLSAFGVKSFREKPNLTTAEEFVSSGRFFWNAGVFLFKVSVMVQNFETLMPELWNSISKIKANLSNLSLVYSKLTPESFDIGVMERLTKQVCVSCDVGWDDLGSWDDLARMMEDSILPSERNKAISVSIASQHNFAYSQNEKAVAFVGVDGLIAVDTPDALLICQKGESQNVKKAVEAFQKIKNSSTLSSGSSQMVWGEMELLVETPTTRISSLRILAGRSLSRTNAVGKSYTSAASTQWTVALGSGILKSEIANKNLALSTTYSLSANEKFEIQNTGETILEIIEVQLLCAHT